MLQADCLGPDAHNMTSEPPFSGFVLARAIEEGFCPTVR
jgi:hypothetical protein